VSHWTGEKVAFQGILKTTFLSQETSRLEFECTVIKKSTTKKKSENKIRR